MGTLVACRRFSRARPRVCFAKDTNTRAPRILEEAAAYAARSLPHVYCHVPDVARSLPNLNSALPRGQWRPSSFTTNELLGLDCRPLESFTWLKFSEQTRLVASNFGGQGGRCQDIQWSDGSWSRWYDECEEEHVNGVTPNVDDVPPAGDPNPGTVSKGNKHVLFADIGKMTVNTPMDTVVWLRVTSETEYRAWNQRINGKARVLDDDGNFGYFGSINLLGPRNPGQKPGQPPPRLVTPVPPTLQTLTLSPARVSPPPLSQPPSSGTPPSPPCRCASSSWRRSTQVPTLRRR